MPTRMPPIITTIFGPKRSTNQPSTGTSQVSVSTKMLKATWIAARPQWYLASIGKTNSVQPYCRLAIITMQTMPNASCPQRKADEPERAESPISDMCFPLPFHCCSRVRRPAALASAGDLAPTYRGGPRSDQQQFRQILSDWPVLAPGKRHYPGDGQRYCGRSVKRPMLVPGSRAWGAL